MVETPPTGLQGVARTAAVLRAVGAGGGGLRLAELADRVPLAKTSLHRLVHALAAEDLVRIDPDGAIWLGASLAVLARSSSDGLAAQVRPVVADLHRLLDETVDVSVAEGARVRFVDQVQSTRPLRVVSAIGASFPMHATANGKALLAALDPQRRGELVGGDLERCTPSTITDPDALGRELEQVRARGVAFDREEHSIGIAAVGAAVVTGAGPVLAISVPVPAERFASREGELADAVRDAAGRAAALLGG